MMLKNILTSGTKCEGLLYYLYMLADGEIAPEEEQIFIKLCMELRLKNDERDNIIKEGKVVVHETKDVFRVIVREKIDEKIEEGYRYSDKKASELARIIWNLVNLGYADTDYSEEEIKIVRYLVDKWNVPEEIYQEMTDISDTMLSLCKQKAWVVSTFPSGEEKSKKEKRIDQDIKKLQKDIKLSIKELTL